MKKYIEPKICILLFDEEDDVLTASNEPQAEYAARQLNEYMFEEKDVNSTTTVKIQDIQVKGE